MLNDWRLQVHTSRNVPKGSRNATLQTPTWLHGCTESCLTLFWFERHKPKQHLNTLIPASPIGELPLMCNGIDCVTRKIEELNETVEPDTNSDPRVQQKAIISLRTKAVTQWNYDYTFGKKGRWHQYLTLGNVCMDQISQLVINKIIKRHNRRISSPISQL